MNDLTQVDEFAPEEEYEEEEPHEVVEEAEFDDEYNYGLTKRKGAYLPHVMAPLTRRGWVASVSGPHGGYTLDVDKPGRAMHEHARLAATGAGNYEGRFGRRRNGLTLGVIQV